MKKFDSIFKWLALHMLADVFRIYGLSLLIILFPLKGYSQMAELDIPTRRQSFTPGELAVLPPYCNAMQGMPDYTSPKGDYWRSWMGDHLQHIHHYCRGLRDEMFATMMARVTPTQRKFLWERAIDEYSYMIRTSSPNMPLLPEFYYKTGLAFLRLDRMPEADAAFTAARKIKPDYWPAYVAWADKLIELKLLVNAKELLDEGLKYMPDNPQIVERLNRLKK